VLTSYRVDAADETEFCAAMAALGRSRQRTGATQWRLFRSGERAATFVEAFVVSSWDEHLRQHRTRLTGHDLLVEQAVERYVQGQTTAEHLIAVHSH